MAFTTPRTWLVGELATAALLNQHLRDNLLFLYTPPLACVERTTGLSIPNNTSTNLTWQTEVSDTNGMVDLAAQSSRITIQTPGRYLFVAMLEFVANATGYRTIVMKKNGGSGAAVSQVRTAGSVRPTRVQGKNDPSSILLMQVVGDFVEVAAHQNSGGALNVTGWFGAWFLGN